MRNEFARLIGIALMAVSWAVPALGIQAQTQESAAMKSANEVFAEKQWTKAAEAYTAVVAAEPDNGQAWQNLAESHLQLKRYDQAGQGFQRAVQLKFQPLINYVNLARVAAARGDGAAAFAQLHEVATSPQGSRMRPFVMMASEFDALKSAPEYKQMLEDFAPCRAPGYRQFDFWVGDWEVRNPAGNVVGSNQVTREQEGCLLVEHWTAVRGGQTGSSFNYFDPGDKKWHQLYVDNTGKPGVFPGLSGEFKDNKMVLLSNEQVNPVLRWTWYVISPGKVRQMAESSSDGEKTWQTVWDSVYERNAAFGKPDTNRE